MERPDLGICLVFNGEIYNYRELRAELESKGHTFRTSSDTEVLIVAYAAWGNEVLQRLRGMFAFGLWNDRTQRLLLARDPMGKKPLCFTYRPGRDLAFASEAKALLQLPWVSRRMNPAAIEIYLDWMYIPERVSVWRDVEKVQPGSFVEVSPDGVRQARYWMPALEEIGSDWEQAVERTSGLIQTATNHRLRADIPIGVFLSGGVDSTLVALTAASESTDQLKTFTVRFEGEDDEGPQALEVARRVGSEHFELDVRLDGPELCAAVVRSFDEPFGDTSALPTLAMARATKEQVSVVLSGDGGDEIFGGYPTYARHVRAGGGDGPPGLLRRLIGWSAARARAGARRLPTPLAATIARAARPYRATIDSHADAAVADAIGRQIAMMRVAHWAEPRQMLEPLLGGQRGIDRAFVTSGCPRGRSPIRDAIMFDQLVYLPGDILKKVDIATMAAGLEVRSPLLDDDLVRLSHTLSVDWLVRSDPAVTPERRGKPLLKALCARTMGDEFTYRPKKGFCLPLQTWLDDRPFVEIVQDGFASSSSPLRHWFVPRALPSVWDDFRAGKRWLAQEVWNLLILDAWATEYRPVV